MDLRIERNLLWKPPSRYTSAATVIFHQNPAVRAWLNKEYTVRNDTAHNYKLVPKEAKDLSALLEELEELVAKF